MRSLLVFLIMAAASGAVVAQEQIDALRGPTPLTDEGEPPRLAKVENRDLRRARNYPEQPPTIPHAIDGYQLDRNYNQCLSCHSRTAIEQSQAPMVSITHFMDREGQILAVVSPRRYFCNQCHVVQHDVQPLVGNDFVDVDSLLIEETGQSSE